MVTDDRDLILRAQSGDIEAFEDLVHRYDRRVLGIALNYVHDADEAEDIYQEVFIRVYRALNGFNFKSSFSTWLYRITANVCLTHRSNNARRQYLSIERELEPESAQARHRLPAHLVSQPRSEDYTFGGEVSSHIEKALAQLSPRQKLVFVLRHYEGYKLREIADFLDCAEGTVKKHLFTATVRMREQLKELVA